MFPLVGIELQRYCCSLHPILLPLICGLLVQYLPSFSLCTLFFLGKVKLTNCTIFAVAWGARLESFSSGYKHFSISRYHLFRSEFYLLSAVNLIMPADLSYIIPNASLEAIDLIKQLCSWDPLRRPTADQCLEHPFFQVPMRIPHAPVDSFKFNLGPEPDLELNLWNFDAAADDCFLNLTLAVNPSAPNLGKVKKSQSIEEDMMICSGFQDHSQQAVFWSLFPSGHNLIPTSVASSLSLSFCSISHPLIESSRPEGFTLKSTLDRPLLATCSPL